MPRNLTAPPRSFWTLGILFLLWNLLGLIAFAGQVTADEEALARLPEAERALYESAPAWATAAFALAVLAGTSGCVALLARKVWAVYLFFASLVGVAAQQFHAFVLADALSVFGPSGLVLPVLVAAGTIFLVWYASRARGLGWIG